jgi:hypothetical protein
MVDPVTGLLVKRATDGVWESAKRALIPSHAMKKENDELRRSLEFAKQKIVELSSQLDASKVFERRKAELECLADDDCLYRRKDRTGPYFCPTCLDADEKFVPLPHGASEGSYYCGLHKQTFETRELRDKRRSVTHSLRTRRGSRTSWMGN